MKRWLLILTMLYGVGVTAYAFNHTRNSASDEPPAQTASTGASQTPAPSPPPQPETGAPQETPQLPPMLEPGTPAPDFTLTGLDGKTYSLKDYRGKKMVLVEIFATWCPHCQHSVEYLNQLEQENGDQLKILALNAGDKPDEPSTALPFKEETGAKYTILDDAPMSLVQEYKASGIPTMYLVDKQGIIRWAHMGTVDDATLAQIRKHL